MFSAMYYIWQNILVKQIYQRIIDVKKYRSLYDIVLYYIIYNMKNFIHTIFMWFMFLKYFIHMCDVIASNILRTHKYNWDMINVQHQVHFNIIQLILSVLQCLNGYFTYICIYI